jgi:hypothetical protein
VLESEAEIGSSDFHAGEIACGFIEQLPEEATLMTRCFFFSRLSLKGFEDMSTG